MGVLIDPSTGYVPFALTLELPWNSNTAFTSSIPFGTYYCDRVKSAKFGITFEVKDVFQRTSILFHSGNLAHDTNGCILVGEEFGILQDEPAVMRSKAGFNNFLKVLKGVETFRLDLRRPCVNPQFP